MKNFIIAAVAATALNSVYAENCASNFSGFYAGIQAGLNSTVGTAKTDGAIGIPNAYTMEYKRSNSSQSFIGGLFVGYGMGVGSCAYVGGEIYANFGNTNLSLTDETHTIGAHLFEISTKQNFKNQFNVGAKVRLGYTITQQSMIFLGLGVEWSDWKYKESGSLQGAGLAAGIRGSFDSYGKKTSVAFAPSVGMESYMTKHFFVRGEYTYVAGPNFNSGADSKAAIKVRANQHRFVLGLGYKF